MRLTVVIKGSVSDIRVSKGSALPFHTCEALWRVIPEMFCTFYSVSIKSFYILYCNVNSSATFINVTLLLIVSRFLLWSSSMLTFPSLQWWTLSSINRSVLQAEKLLSLTGVRELSCITEFCISVLAQGFAFIVFFRSRMLKLSVRKQSNEAITEIELSVLISLYFSLI